MCVKNNKVRLLVYADIWFHLYGSCKNVSCVLVDGVFLIICHYYIQKVKYLYYLWLFVCFFHCSVYYKNMFMCKNSGVFFFLLVLNFSTSSLFFFSFPHCIALLTCFLFLPAPAGLLVPHCGEVRRHAEGQGAAASAAAAGAADAAAQQCDHLGGPDGPGGPHSTVSGSKTTSTLGPFSFL